MKNTWWKSWKTSQPYGRIFHKGVQEENNISRYVYNNFGKPTKKSAINSSRVTKELKLAFQNKPPKSSYSGSWHTSGWWMYYELEMYLNWSRHPTILGGLTAPKIKMELLKVSILWKYQGKEFKTTMACISKSSDTYKHSETNQFLQN